MINSELVDSGVKLAPPALVSGGYFLGISWDNWLVIMTLIYTVMQMGWFIYEKVQTIKKRRKAKCTQKLKEQGTS
ncbi:class II holin [Escherichia phage 6948]|uniref:Class II holin n=1 Tax=Escherichia phage 6948 TaxID=2912288 RepID=A0A9E7SBS7_9CAUD|nr:class II holin [Escherichia phage 6948]